jgi:hypothetical protein
MPRLRPRPDVLRDDFSERHRGAAIAFRPVDDRSLRTKLSTRHWKCGALRTGPTILIHRPAIRLPISECGQFDMVKRSGMAWCGRPNG